MMEKFFGTEKANDRAHLLNLNKDNVEHAYTHADDRGVVDPVILLLDLRDKKALVLAEACIRSKDRIRKAIDDCARKKVIPTAVIALSHDEAVEAMGSVSELALKALSSTIPRGYFRVMVIALEGHSHLACPEPKPPEEEYY
jgi:hypothetical protein